MAKFDFTGEIWHELNHKVDYATIKRVLNDNLGLINYSPEVKSIFFCYIAVSQSITHIFPEKQYYSKKDNCLSLALALDFERLMKADLQEAKQMMAELYLSAIPNYHKVRGMKKVAFDTEKFYQDVRNLFVKEGWISENENPKD